MELAFGVNTAGAKQILMIAKWRQIRTVAENNWNALKNICSDRSEPILILNDTFDLCIRIL